jgi:ABC-2 type transport system ATP-binding protein
VPLYTEMRVEEYLDYRAKLKGVERKVRSKRIDYCVERCRIREVRRRLIGTLSKGYRQRVGLADAMVHDPAILILDEPTVGLDPLQIRETLNTIKELGRKHTILLSTHILPEVEAICERVIIISRGRIALDQKLSELATEEAVIVLEVRGPAEQVANVLKTTDGVARVATISTSDGVTSYEIRTHQERDLREALFQRVAKNGWSIRRLDLRRRRLEDHFVSVLMGDDDAFTLRPGRSASTAVQPAASTAVTTPSA